MKRISIIFVLLTLIPTLYYTVLLLLRSNWVIVDAEITFISSMDGTVEGTFTDFNGTVHSEQFLYIDGKFQKWGLFKPQFPSIADKEKYIGKTVRIMYDPNTINSRDIDIASYDNLLRDIIVSVSVFGVSIVLLAVVLLIRIIRKKGNRKA